LQGGNGCKGKKLYVCARLSLLLVEDGLDVEERFNLLMLSVFLGQS
jgi:hypothetical protein